MRLTCPNCGAQYEVPDDIIPTGGRDVQCSNCGNTWFQVHPDMQAEEPVEDVVEDAVAEASTDAASQETPEEEVFEEIEPPELSIEAEPEDNQDFFEDAVEENPDDLDLGGEDWDLETEDNWTEAGPSHSNDGSVLDEGAEKHVEEVTDVAPEREVEAQVEVGEDPEPDDYEESLETTSGQKADHDTEATSEAAAVKDTLAEAEPAPKPRGLDASVKDILREEVEYESRARAAEQPESLETQGDLGLDRGEDRSTATNRQADESANRLRRLRGQDDAATAAAVAATVRSSKDTRRDLLPDIEEINSTLRTSGDAPRNPDLGQKTSNGANRARGFRLGFALVILLAGAAVFVYSSHDSLSQSYPQAAPYIDSYMASANGVRVWLDDKVAGLFLKLNALTGQS